jgi:hypothetical protein
MVTWNSHLDYHMGKVPFMLISCVNIYFLRSHGMAGPDPDSYRDRDHTIGCKDILMAISYVVFVF